MVVSIHQPNFFPWYPYFKKIQQSDVFVILQNCQFEKNSYTNRFLYNKIWNTMSVSRSLDPVIKKKYINYKYDWNKIKKRMAHNKLLLDEYDKYIDFNLAKTNIGVIRHICNKLKIKTKIVSDYNTTLKGTERIVDICRKFNADIYLTNSKLKPCYLNHCKFEDIKLKTIKCEERLRIPILEYLKYYV